MARTSKKIITIGMNIKTHRTECGLTKTALAEMIGVTVANICHWENDVAAPRPDKAAALARLFNCDKAEFMAEPHSVASNIISFRTGRGMTQAELAAELNVSQGTVAAWEADRMRPKQDKVVVMASIFGCPESALKAA